MFLLLGVLLLSWSLFKLDDNDDDDDDNDDNDDDDDDDEEEEVTLGICNKGF